MPALRWHLIFLLMSTRLFALHPQKSDQWHFCLSMSLLETLLLAFAPCATFLERQRRPELAFTCYGGFLVDAKSNCGHVICNQTSAPPARLLYGEKISEQKDDLSVIEHSILWSLYMSPSMDFAF